MVKSKTKRKMKMAATHLLQKILLLLGRVSLIYNVFVNVCFIGVTPKEKPPLNVVGDVDGRVAIIIVSCINLYLIIMLS